MAPLPVATSAALAARIPRYTPWKLMSAISWWVFRSSPSSVPNAPIPALFTRMSSFPNRSTVAATAVSQSSSRVTSSC